MMTVKAMINFLFYQIWHFAASGSFYYQFHSWLSRDVFCFDFPNTRRRRKNLHYSLMFFNIKYPLLISACVYTTCRVHIRCLILCYCCFYLFTWLTFTLHVCTCTWSCSSYLIQVKLLRAWMNIRNGLVRLYWYRIDVEA